MALKKTLQLLHPGLLELHVSRGRRARVILPLEIIEPDPSRCKGCAYDNPRNRPSRKTIDVWKGNKTTEVHDGQKAGSEQTNLGSRHGYIPHKRPIIPDAVRPEAVVSFLEVLKRAIKR